MPKKPAYYESGTGWRGGIFHNSSLTVENDGQAAGRETTRSGAIEQLQALMPGEKITSQNYDQMLQRWIDQKRNLQNQ